MTLVFVIAQFLLWQFVFSFQRLTLKKARVIAAASDLDVHQSQLALTPGWMGFLGWVSWVLSIGVIILTFVQYGLVWAAVLAGCIYLGLYALVSAPFEKLIANRSQVWMKDALKSLKKTGGGYLAYYQIERALAEGKKDESRK